MTKRRVRIAIQDCDVLRMQEDECLAIGTGFQSQINAAGMCVSAIALGEMSTAEVKANGGYAIATGYRSRVRADGVDVVAASLGIEGKASGGPGAWLVLAEHDPGTRQITAVRAVRVGQDGILPYVEYSLIGGVPVAAELSPYED